MGDKMIYSSFKAVHHQERIADLKNGRFIIPTQVQLDVTNRCNHSCIYCFYRCARTKTLNALFNERDQFDYVRLVSLIGEMAKLGVGAIQFTGGGEPFMHPRIYDILDLTILSGMKYALITNGAMMDLSHMDLYRHASWIRFSLDAATPAMHRACQHAPMGEFKTILEKIRRIHQECPATIVGISFVVNPINYAEIHRAAVMARDLGVHNIRYSVAYTPRGIALYKNIWSEIERQILCVKKMESRQFKIFNLVMEHLENLDMSQKGYSFCGYQHFTAVLGADMELYPCCTLKYNPLGKLGNLKDKTFFELWTGGARAAWLKRDHLKLVCDKNPCWMDGKNQFLSYLVDPDPPHVNFI